MEKFVDYSNPASILEENESEERSRDCGSCPDVDLVLRRIAAWIAEGQTGAGIALRSLVYARNLGVIDLNLEDIAVKFGQGRSAAHKVSKDFEEVFGFRSILNRSDDVRAKYSESWHKRMRT